LVQISKHIRTPDQKNIDWHTVIKELDPAWQDRWHPRRVDMMTGVEEYEDITEVDAILNKYREQLYLFFSTQGKKDRDMRDTICHELIRVAQKGNVDAKDTIITYATFTMDDWIDRIPRLACFRTLPEVSNNRLKKCIRGYQFWKNGPAFFGYLYASLIAEAKSIYINSLDQLSYPHESHDKKTLYDKVISD
jgi:hypothetical protein